MARKALIVVDTQIDFYTGSLACNNVEPIIDKINQLLESKIYDTVIFTQDWHPANHISFASVNKAEVFSVKKVAEGTEYETDQIMWPDHCIQNSKGAEFISKIKSEFANIIIRKGMNPMLNSYSGMFDDQRKKQTGLLDLLRMYGMKDSKDEVHVCGLATDKCVDFTYEDCKIIGCKLFVIGDCCAGVTEKDHIDTLKKFEKEGTLINSKDIIETR